MTPDDMIRRVVEHRGVSMTKLRGRSRVASVARARHEAMFILRNATELSYPEIGRLFGGRDHTSVMHGVAKIGCKAAARAGYEEELLSLVRPVRVERLGCASVSCSGCIPAGQVVVDEERRAA